MVRGETPLCTLLSCLLIFPGCHKTTDEAAWPRVHAGTPGPGGIEADDRAELRAASERMKGVAPVRSRPTLYHGVHGSIRAVTFSHDGRLFATAGTPEVRLWNAVDWSLRRVIRQEGGVREIAFSPDDRLLYVAGGAPKFETVARFEVDSGRRDRSYKVHGDGIHWMKLSPDGKTVVTASPYDRKTCVWDAETGTVKRSFDGLPLAVTPDFRILMRRTRDKSWVLERVEADAPGTELASLRTGPAMAAFSPDGRRLIVVEFRKGPETSFKWSANVRVLNADAGFTETASRFVQGLSARRLCVSPDGKTLAIGGRYRSLWLFSLPQLRVVKRIKFDHHSNGVDDSIVSLAFSPDCRFLVAVQAWRPAPHVLRTDTWEVMLPYDGHGGYVAGIYFCSDGKRIRTLGTDNTVCFWDAATMRMIERIRLPPGQRMLTAREPDGRYIFCFDADAYDRPYPYRGGEADAMVFDAERREPASRLKLQIGQWSTRVHWLDERQALVATRKKRCIFDYLTGKIVSEAGIEDSDLWNGRGDATEDGAGILVIQGGLGDTQVRVKRVDAATGKARILAGAKLPRFTGNDRGLVPGGRYFYMASPGVYIFEREPVKLVSANHFGGRSFLGVIGFSSDGRRYAVSDWTAMSPSGGAASSEPKSRPLVRVHDTLTGSTLFAFAASSLSVRAGRFAPDGKRLVIANGDGTLEIWELPEVAK